MSADLSAIVSRLEAVASKLESAAAGGGGGGGAPVEAGEVPAFVNEFDDLVAGEFKAFLDLSNKVGDAAAAAAPMFEKSFQLTRDLLCMVGASKKPAGWPGAMPDNITAIIQEVGGMMGEMGNLPGGREISKAVAEGSQALSWVVMEPLPAPHVKDMGEAMWFWGQKVVVANKGKNQDLVDWANAFKALLAALQVYVKKCHTTGLAWNPKGGDAGAASGGAAPAAKPAAAAPAAAAPKKAAAAAPAGGGKGDMFAELQAKKNDSAGVGASMKNQGVKKNAPGSVTGAVKMAAKKHKITKKMGDPKAALEGRKWAVEYQIDNKAIMIEGCNAKQSVNIYRCIGSVIVITGKIGAILLDDCEKTAVVVQDGCVSSIDIVNSKSCEIQIDKNSPTLMIDKVDGCQVYLGKEATDIGIICSKCSEINVSVPGATEEDDPIEAALPEQFQSNFKDGKWITEAIKHEG